MTLQQIRYILEISRCGSISKAAQSLCLTQPYLSNLLRELELELRITIFHRGRNGVTLTNAGSDFLRYARPLVEQEDKILSLYARHTQAPPFYFKISTQRFPFIIKAFYECLEKKPTKYEVHLRECSMDRVIADVYEHRSNLGMISLSDATEVFIKKYLSVRSLEFNKLCSVRPCVFFRDSHPIAAYAEVDLTQMYTYPFASFEGSSIDFSEEALLPGTADLSRRIYVIDRATMINTLTNTDAFSIGSGILPPGYAGPGLVGRPILGHGKEMHLGWIQPAGLRLSDDETSFLLEVRRVLESFCG